MKKLIFVVSVLIAILLFSGVAQGLCGKYQFGSKYNPPSVDYDIKDCIRGQFYTCLKTGIAKNITGWVTLVGSLGMVSKYKFALYTWLSNNSAGDLLGYTQEYSFTHVFPAAKICLYSLNFTNSPVVYANTKYFIVVWGWTSNSKPLSNAQIAVNTYPAGSSNNSIYLNMSYGSFPSNLNGQTRSYLKTFVMQCNITLENKPVQSNPVPSNNSAHVGISPLLNITVTDDELACQSLNVYFYGNSSGSWSLIGSNLSVGAGTYCQRYSGAVIAGKKYYWMVCLNDGQQIYNRTLWVNKTYNFIIKGWTVVEDSFNGLFSNTRFKLIDNSFNGQFRNIMFKLLDNSFNGQFRNTRFRLLNNGFNGSFISPVLWRLADDRYNGSFVSLPVWHMTDNVFNGSFRNISIFIAGGIIISNENPLNNSVIDYYFDNETFYISFDINRTVITWYNVSVFFDGVLVHVSNHSFNASFLVDVYGNYSHKLYYDTTYNWTVRANSSDGNTTSQLFVFNTGTEVYGASLAFDNGQFVIFMILNLFGIIFSWGYWSKKRSGGFLMIFAGFLLIAFGVLIGLGFIPYAGLLMVPFGIFIIILGAKKAFYGPETEEAVLVKT